MPYLLLAPGLLWLLVFFAVPLYYMARISLETGTIDTGYQFTWHFQTYTDALSDYDSSSCARSGTRALATLIALSDRLPARLRDRVPGRQVAERAAVPGDLPFFVTYLIRTLSWETILDDDGIVVHTCSRSA